MQRRKMVQLELPPKGRGGRRPGAGRPKNPRSGVPHLRRPTLKARFPLHVTLRIRQEVGNLRTDKRFRRIQRAFRYGCDRFGMRLIEFSIQSNHIHLIVEADDKPALSKGMQGLLIRVARGVNRASDRTGHVFADRYHARVLRTRAEVRNAVHYVVQNFNKHAHAHAFHIDPYSSMSGEAVWYEHARGSTFVVARPKTWLLRTG